MSKNSSEILAAIEGVNVTLPANLFYSDFIVHIDLIEDDVKVCSKKNVPYKKSNKVNEIKVSEISMEGKIKDGKEDVSYIELDFDKLKKYKFDPKKKYRIIISITSSKKKYSIVFVRKEYNTLGVLKTHKFVTVPQYLIETLVKQMGENNTK